MHQAEPYGHLVVNSQPIKAETLARMVGAKVGEVIRWQSELEQAGVFDRDGDTIISRRMVRDETIRRLRAEGGKLGGNPALKDNHKVPDKVNHEANLQPTPSTSSSSSSSKESKTLSGKPDLKAQATEILNFLNAKANKAFRPVDQTLKPIIARLRDGYSPDDIRAVVVAKCREWLPDPKMAYCVRPKTLFGAENFANYEGQLQQVSNEQTI